MYSKIVFLCALVATARAGGILTTSPAFSYASPAFSTLRYGAASIAAAPAYGVRYASSAIAAPAISYAAPATTSYFSVYRTVNNPSHAAAPAISYAAAPALSYAAAPAVGYAAPAVATIAHAPGATSYSSSYRTVNKPFAVATAPAVSYAAPALATVAHAPIAVAHGPVAAYSTSFRTDIKVVSTAAPYKLFRGTQASLAG